MPYTRTLVCFANSTKLGGRCIAGKEPAGGNSWIRPVSDKETGELSLANIRFENGRVPALLDIVSMRLLRPAPKDYQTENHVIDAGCYWKTEGRLRWREALGLVDAPSGALWINGSSSWAGLNDRIDEAQASNLPRSLYLVRPTELRLVVGVQYDSRAVRARFTLNEEQYNLRVTDPVAKESYLLKKDGNYPIESALLCISLSEPLKGYVYKLVAGVIAR
jgi:hypothetical protein